jgi:glycogen debranching enzyme
MAPVSDQHEWLEADGLGGFASGKTSGIRTRPDHALLLASATPPTGRQVFVAGMDVSVEIGAGVFFLSSQPYDPDLIHPDGASRIHSFTPDPWPTWRTGPAPGSTASPRRSIP